MNFLGLLFPEVRNEFAEFLSPESPIACAYSAFPPESDLYGASFFFSDLETFLQWWNA